MGAFDQVRPTDARPIEVTGVGAANASDEIVGVGNYLFVFKGYKPKPEELNHVVGTAPKYAQSPLPTLPGHLPAGFQPNSERYITGPESLNRFAPQISPSTAAFHFNAEGVAARYGKPGKETTLVVFNYPTMEMARDRIPHFQQVAGSGGEALRPAGRCHAERGQSGRRREASFSGQISGGSDSSGTCSDAKDNAGNFFLNIFTSAWCWPDSASFPVWWSVDF